LDRDFVDAAAVSEATAAALGDLYDGDVPKHRIVPLQGDDFLNALKKLAGAPAPEAGG
jgi:hypothetical protein